MPMSATAWRTSSSLKGLMIAVISFMSEFPLLAMSNERGGIGPAPRVKVRGRRTFRS
jgi:hypothetical protein